MDVKQNNILEESITSIDISTINYRYIGVMFTNVAILWTVIIFDITGV
jgi:ribosomal protein S2